MNKYFTIFMLSVKHSLRNVKGLVGLSIFLITCLLIFAHLWKFAAAKSGVVGLDPDQLLWYIAFNEWVLVSIPDVQDDMAQDLHSGRLAYLLPRPMSYLGGTFCEALGTACVNLTMLGAVTFLFTWANVGGLPFHPSGLPLIFILGVMACSVAIIFQMLVGLSALWLSDATPLFWIWEKSLFMLGGLILPLTVYPQWLQTVASLTPFPGILGQRSALALDYSVQNVVSVASLLIIWAAIGLVALMMLYRRGLRILNIEGG